MNVRTRFGFGEKKKRNRSQKEYPPDKIWIIDGLLNLKKA